MFCSRARAICHEAARVARSAYELGGVTRSLAQPLRRRHAPGVQPALPRRSPIRPLSPAEMPRGLMIPSQRSFKPTVIDLTSPPSSPAAKNHPSAAAIGFSYLFGKFSAKENLPYSNQPSSRTKTEAIDQSKVLGKRKAEKQPTSCDRNDASDLGKDDSDCVVVSKPKLPEASRADPLARRTSAPSTNKADDEVSFVGRTGSLALFDFPHVREHCVANPWAPGAAAAARCDNCYCYVCDANASGCPEWSTHCQATHKDAKWQRVRASWSKRPNPSTASRSPAPGAPLVSAAASCIPTVVTSDRRSLDAVAPPRDSMAWTAERVMHEVAQVYPLEEPEPAGLRASLRPYQKQSLAFMLNMERAPEEELPHLKAARGELASKGLYLGQIPPGVVRGGWLCDETGMGKTCVCAALMLAQPTAPVSSMRDLAELRRRMRNDTKDRVEVTIDGTRYESIGRATDFTQPEQHLVPPGAEYYKRVDTLSPEWAKWEKPPTVRFGFTVVVTSNALLGQWQDELRKFAPSLRVFTYYGSNKDAVYSHLHELDVILTTPGVDLFWGASKYVHFDRLIIDESHTLKQGRGGFQRSAEYCKFIWGVTATPITSCIQDLGHVADLLGLVRRLGEACVNGFSAGVVALLRRLMIRHTKDQRIGGAVALALPDADAETVWLEMDTTERAAYGAWRKRGTTQWQVPLFHVERLMSDRRLACSGFWRKYDVPFSGGQAGAKVRALLADLEALRRADSSVHAVVFTHHTHCYDLLRERIAAAGFLVCGFKGGDAVKKRHDTIRNFQASIDAAQSGRAVASNGRAKVFIATIKVGNVGLTLTAATRVYLMEPCLDPSMEVQAAGRIHRLGQTKHVLVKRFCYRNSIDASVIRLHDRMRRGEIAIANACFPKAAVHILLKDLSGD